MKREDIEQALELYDKFLFWDMGRGQIKFLSPEFVIPRIVRYGSLNDVMRLFVIYSKEEINQVIETDRELDRTERTFLMIVNDLER